MTDATLMGLDTGFARRAADRDADGSGLAVHLYPDDQNPESRLWTVPGTLCYSTHRPLTELSADKWQDPTLFQGDRSVCRSRIHQR